MFAENDIAVRWCGCPHAKLIIPFLSLTPLQGVPLLFYL